MIEGELSVPRNVNLPRGLRRDAGLVLVSVAGTALPLAVWAPGSLSALVGVSCAVVGASMYARLAMGRWPAAAQVLLTGVMLGVAGAPPRTILVAMLTGLVVSELVARVSPQRMNFVRVGVGAAFVAGLLTLTGAWEIAHLSPGQAIGDTGAAMLGALLGPGLMLAFAPVTEWLFEHVTPMTLTEWLSYDHPLLQDLAVKAPGTFQHSVNVGHLQTMGAPNRVLADCGRRLANSVWHITQRRRARS